MAQVQLRSCPPHLYITTDSTSTFSTEPTHLINRKRVRCWRFGAAARREEGEYPSWIFDRRATRLQRQRSALRAKFWRAAGGGGPQSHSPLCFLLSLALPAPRHNFAPPLPRYVDG